MLLATAIDDPPATNLLLILALAAGVALLTMLIAVILFRMVRRASHDARKPHSPTRVSDAWREAGRRARVGDGASGGDEGDHA